ncbi:hypothetical protein L202_03083 [Cryptococcus amylolentus CBS 6039]|uniref:Large ribosomal subunit protein mL59 domain-containing protein n=2 Tax=Cryptococcus amylolentus TaxID=104669 RepID=A0A1E3HXB0_9TREE|nr:hypothetical protein L202_03083 [Cryptococcus amylolentus CBS 6039]ODN80973.1 hypothetical protein L202_03083 [Cryptococcus amylolentus CBS 6039]ODO09452.1 hypothetical protein I350_03052 [Cryptococcus amylolentus CBS 6273]
MAARRAYSSLPAPNTAAAAPSINSAFIPAADLPKPLFRRIASQLAYLRSQGKDPATVSIPNPFLLHRAGQRADVSALTGLERFYWRKPQFSARRQKLLLQQYDPSILPPSPLNPTAEPRPIQWEDGTVINWEGEVLEKAAKQSPYDGRKVMFKGHIDERNKPQKVADRQERMKGMDKRIAAWRKSKADDKIRARPSLPF